MSIAPTTASAMAAHWTARAHRFDAAASHNRHRDAWLRVFHTALPSGPSVAVDLGCGTGACAILLASLGHSVTAVDGSEGMLSQARAAAEAEGVRVKFIARDMDKAALPPQSADIVTMRNVLWTLEKPAEALKLAHELLRPHGRLLISDGLWRRKPDPAMQEFEASLPNACGVSEDEARAWLAEAGFTGVQSWQHLFDTHPYGDIYDEPGSHIPFFVLTSSSRP